VLTLLLKSIAIWLLLIGAEVIHGALREAFLKPRIGDRPARRWCVFSGSLIVFTVSVFTIQWLGSPSTPQLIGVGTLWVTLTVVFEVAFGRCVARLPWKRIREDFDLRRGGLLPIGLALMLVSPLLASMLRNALGF
jgi:peptidoglycan/LPS O-acetylase OafA/YrhL